MAQAHISQIRRRYTTRQLMVLAVLAVLVTYVVATQFRSFAGSIATLKDAYVPFLIIAVCCWAGTVFAAALVYCLLAIRPLLFWPTFGVQVASGFVNKLIPAGAGAIAIGTQYLMSRGHNAVAATSIALLNNVLGFVGNAMLLCAAAAVSDDVQFHLIMPRKLLWWISVMVGVLLMVGALYIWRRGYHRTARMVVRRFFAILRNYRRHPWRVVLALGSSIVVTIGYASCLYATALAFNVHISVFQLVAVLTIGVAAGSAMPTPGGLGGAEAGLAAALIALGVAAHQALAVVFAYRLITFWLPMIPGALSLRLIKLKA